MIQLIKEFRNFLKEREEFEKYKMINIYQKNSSIDLGTLTLEEETFLKELVLKSNSFEGDLVEIGTLFGFTTQKIASWMGKNKKTITVDIFAWNPIGLTADEHERLTKRNLYYLEQKNLVEIVKSDKNIFFSEREFEIAPSFVFLDAVHDYEETYKDIKWAKSLNVPVISGHDYSKEFPGVMQAVDEFGGPKKLEGTVWVL